MFCRRLRRQPLQPPPNRADQFNERASTLDGAGIGESQMNSCLVYFAKTNTCPIPDAEFFQLKDTDTRLYAKNKAAGVRILAGDLLFEIIEAPMNIAEQLLDHSSESEFWGEPEILFLMPTKAQSFQTWKLINVAPVDDFEQAVQTLRVLAEQSEQDPNQIPKILPRMLDLFQSKQPPAEKAA